MILKDLSVVRQEHLDRVYFTTDVISAKRCATKYKIGKLYTVKLDVRNSLKVANLRDPAIEILSPVLFRRRSKENSNYCHWIKSSDLKNLEKRGYDAIMRDEIMVFNPEQIKILSIKTVREE